MKDKKRTSKRGVLIARISNIFMLFGFGLFSLPCWGSLLVLYLVDEPTEYTGVNFFFDGILLGSLCLIIGLALNVIHKKTSQKLLSPKNDESL